MKQKTAQPVRIDLNITVFMIAVSLISVFILAFRYQNTEPCGETRIMEDGTVNYEGALIRFRIRGATGSRYEWTFSDGFKPVTHAAEIRHAFLKAGQYTVAVKIDGRCNGFTTVTVASTPELVRDYSGSFIAPDTAFVNKPVRFRDTCSDAFSWEWNFGESELLYTEKEPVYVYLSAGEKTVTLKLNGRPDRVYVRSIYVKEPDQLIPLPPPPPEQPVYPVRPPVIRNSPSDTIQVPESLVRPKDSVRLYPVIHASEMASLLEQVVSGKKQAEHFFKYFCDNKDITVMYNGTEMSFSGMCIALAGYKSPKKIRKPEVEIQQNSLNNCISRMNVIVQKRKLTDRLLNRND